MTGSRWERVARGGGHDYAARFDALAADGHDVHGEADLVTRLAPAAARVLDAGCGTGRVGIELAGRGFDVVGVDLDPSMLEVARERAPDIPWVEADLATLDPDRAEPFDLVVAAGNVVPLLGAGTEPAAIANLACSLVPGGLLVAGFGLDPAHLPLEEAPVRLADHDRWCAAAGLALHDRLATWDGAPYDGGGYAVSIHRRA